MRTLAHVHDFGAPRRESSTAYFSRLFLASVSPAQGCSSPTILHRVSAARFVVFPTSYFRSSSARAPRLPGPIYSPAPAVLPLDWRPCVPHLRFLTVPSPRFLRLLSPPISVAALHVSIHAHSPGGSAFPGAVFVSVLVSVHSPLGSRSAGRFLSVRILCRPAAAASR